MSTERRYCSGCGVVIQTEDPDLPGFVPDSALDREPLVCRRCFRIRNYGEFSRIVVPSEIYRQEVSTIALEPGLVLYVLDVFDLAGSLIRGLDKLIGKSKVVVLVNKVDVLPREVRVEAMRQWIFSQVEVTGVHPEDVLFVSGQTRQGMDAVMDLLQQVAPDIAYVVGMANVGKSTLLNQLYRRTSAGEPFTASRVPGTTLRRVEVGLPVGSQMVRLIDTPGLIHGTRAIDVLCGDCLKAAVPMTAIKPRVFQLDPSQSLWFGNFARLDFESGTHQSVACYVSNSLVVHRTRLDRAWHIHEHHADDILKTRCSDCQRALGDFREYSVHTGAASSRSTRTTLSIPPAGSDLTLSGLGWISLRGRSFQGHLYVRSTVEVGHRPRLVGDISRALERKIHHNR